MREKRVIGLLFLLLTACAADPTPRANVHLTLVGSDAMQWLGQSLAGAFMQQHPTVTVTVQTANSDVGLQATVEYSDTIGMVSRTIKPSELSQARAIVVARDGIAVIVNKSNPINAIMRSQIAQVFSGQILTWPTGSNQGKNIIVVSRDEGSGTREAFEAMAMTGQRVTRTAVVMPSEASMVDYVAQHPEAIGYATMSMLTPGVSAMTVDDVSLSIQTVESQKYPFVRTLTFVVPLTPDPETQEFVDFTLSPAGQKIVQERFGRAP